MNEVILKDECNPDSREIRMNREGCEMTNLALNRRKLVDMRGILKFGRSTDFCAGFSVCTASPSFGVGSNC
jgi:hypothetical protein